MSWLLFFTLLGVFFNGLRHQMEEEHEQGSGGFIDFRASVLSMCMRMYVGMPGGEMT